MFGINHLILRTTKQFSIAGPWIGGTFYFFLTALLGRVWNNPSASASSLLITFGVWMMLAYFVGLVPAALTGAALGAIRCNRSLSSWTLSAATIGLLAGAVTGSAIDIYNAMRSGSFLPIGSIFLGVSSCISALICSCLFRPVKTSAETPA